MILLAKQAFGTSGEIVGESSSDGTLLVDVPVEEAMLGGTVSEQVLKEADLPSELLYSLNSSSVSSLREAVRKAGPTRFPYLTPQTTCQINLTRARHPSDRQIRQVLPEGQLGGPGFEVAC